ncbi:hypothetical protein ABZ723_28845 [Streptomyces sp. NPDC006700]|uniref:hypothetical protein n=1 Tax=unclassified Streptomyces TaxID=2593676 RepID=UPI0033D85AC9
MLKIDADGLFQTERRGPNLCVQAFGEPPFAAESLESLISAFVPLGGRVEAPAERRFIVVTVPVAAGFPAVEAVMETWAAGVGVLLDAHDEVARGETAPRGSVAVVSQSPW